MERCPSGRRSTPGKRVYGQLYQGFKSLSLRQKKAPRNIHFSVLFCFPCHFITHVQISLRDNGMITDVIISNENRDILHYIFNFIHQFSKDFSDSICLPHPLFQLFQMFHFYFFFGTQLTLHG